MQNQLLEKKAEIKDLTAKKEDLLKTNAGLNTTAQSFKSELTKKTMEVNDLNDSVDKLNTIKDEQLVKISSLDTTVQYLQQDIESYLIKINELNSDKTDLSNKIFELETENEKLSKGSEYYISEISSLENQVKYENTQIQNLNLEIKRRDNEIKDFKLERESLRKNIENLNLDRKKANGEIVLRTSEISKLNKDIENQKSENAKLQQEKISLEKELESFSTLIEFKKLYDEVSKNPEIKEKCKPFFGEDESVVSILVNIAKERSLANFWQYIFDSIDKDLLKENEIEILKKMFDISFKYLQVTDNNYKRLDTTLGISFNNKTMRKYKAIGIGKVSKIWLLGFGYKTNILKLSLVSVE